MRQDRWLALFLLARGLATIAAGTLLIAHPVTGHDGWLMAGAAVMGPGVMIMMVAASDLLRRAPAAWLVDSVLVLALVVASEDWRSPFYVLALTTLIFPAVTLGLRRSTIWGVAFSGAYLGVAVLTGLDSRTLDSTIRLETIATHMLVPVLVVLSLAYASDLLMRLGGEQRRATHLALENERRRIAWDLHDSAKQRVHAAHLLLSAADGGLARGAAVGELMQQASAQLQAATADMDTSVKELRSPLDGRRLDTALRERAAELRPLTSARIEVRGEAPAALPVTVTAHAYRIAGEALLNAVRHAGASRIEV
ncbi:MAG TPA: histidine kinase, partial [Baekduia sp.]|nr:histidine kinase [Baekduia sp.]